MRQLWILAVVACGGGGSDQPVVQPEPVPAPPPVSAPAPRESHASVATEPARPTTQTPKAVTRKPVVHEVVALDPKTARAMADLLIGEGSTGALDVDMSKRRPGADLDSRIADIRDPSGSVAVGGGAGRGGKVDPLAPTPSSGPTGRISVADKSAIDESTLTPDAVLAKIMSAYMASVKRCYKDVLKKDATARGKLTLRLTVNQTGRAVSTSARSFSTDLDGCVGGLMPSWRFPVPKDKDGEATDATFAINLQLIPD